MTEDIWEPVDVFALGWYAVKDGPSYSSVRCKATLSKYTGEQELWLVPQTSHVIAEHIASVHNASLNRTDAAGDKV